MHGGITHQIKTDKDFGILLNVVCNIREKLDESFNEEDRECQNKWLKSNFPCVF